MNLKHLLALLIVTIPLYGYPLLNLNVRAVRLDMVLFGVVVLFVALQSIKKSGRLCVRMDRFLMLLIAFNVFLALSVIPSVTAVADGNIVDFITTWFQYLIGTAFLVSLCFVDTELEIRDVQWLLKWYVLVAVAIAGFGVLQSFVANALGSDLLYLNHWNVRFLTSQSRYYMAGLGLSRATSLFIEPRYLGNFLVTPVILLILSLRDESFDLLKRTDTTVFALILGIGGVVLSFSASAFFVLASMAALYPVIDRQPLRILRYYAGSLLSIAVAVVLFPEATSPLRLTFQRFTLTPYEYQHIFDLSVPLGGLPRYVRGAYLSIETALTNPLLGVGLNQGYTRIQQHVVFYLLPPLDLMQSIGLVGFGVFALLVATLLRNTWQLAKVADGVNEYESALAKAGFIFVAAVLLKSIPGSRYNYASTWFWFEFTFGCLLYYLVQRSRIGLLEAPTGD